MDTILRHIKSKVLAGWAHPKLLGRVVRIKSTTTCRLHGELWVAVVSSLTERNVGSGNSTRAIKPSSTSIQRQILPKSHGRTPLTRKVRLLLTRPQYCSRLQQLQEVQQEGRLAMVEEEDSV